MESEERVVSFPDPQQTCVEGLEIRLEGERR